MTTETPLAILSRRLASGEISIEEFERLKTVIDIASAPSVPVQSAATVEALPPAPAPMVADSAPPAPAIRPVPPPTETLVLEPSTPETPPPTPVAAAAPVAAMPAPFETEAQRMLRRNREWQDQQRAGGSGIVAFAAPAAAAGGTQRLSPGQTVPVPGNPGGIDKAWLIGGGIGAGALVLMAVAFSGGPNCEVSGITTRSETMWLNGTFDAGVVVSANVTSSASGMVNVQALLSTSEGSFQNTRPYMLTEGQPTRVEIQFPEPTINVNLNDMQAIVQCAGS